MNGIAAIIGGALLAAFLFLEGRVRVGATARSLVTGVADRGSTRRLGIAYGASIGLLALSAVLAALGALALPAELQWAGIALMVIGIALRFWSVRVLGSSYTRTLRTAADQRVVRTGPYRAVRHPGYTGSILMWTGVALSSGDLVGVITIVPLIVWAYVLRVAAEDRMLVARFGDEYATYAREVRRLVPYVY